MLEITHDVYYKDIHIHGNYIYHRTRIYMRLALHDINVTKSEVLHEGLKMLYILLLLRGVPSACLIAPVRFYTLLRSQRAYTHVTTQTLTYQLIEYLHEKDLICACPTS